MEDNNTRKKSEGDENIQTPFADAMDDPVFELNDEGYVVEVRRPEDFVWIRSISGFDIVLMKVRLL